MGYQDGWFLFDNDLNALLNQHDYGVISGLSVSQQSTPSMGVTVAPGKCVIGGKIYYFTSSTDVSLEPADSANPRKDLIIVDSSGNITKVTGTPEAASPSDKTGPETSSPKPPNIPSNAVILAEVWVAAGASAIYNDDITDRRTFSWFSRFGSSYLVFKEGSYYKAMEGTTHRIRFDNTDLVALLETIRDQVVDDNELPKPFGAIHFMPNTIYEWGSKFTFGTTSSQDEMTIAFFASAPGWLWRLPVRFESVMSSPDYFIQAGNQSAGYRGYLTARNVAFQATTANPAKGLNISYGSIQTYYVRVDARRTPALRLGRLKNWEKLDSSYFRLEQETGNAMLVADAGADTNLLIAINSRFVSYEDDSVVVEVESSSFMRDLHFYGCAINSTGGATNITLFKNSANSGYAVFYGGWFEYGTYALDCSTGGPFTLIGCKKFNVTNNWTLGSGVKLNYMGLQGWGSTYEGYGTVTG